MRAGAGNRGKRELPCNISGAVLESPTVWVNVLGNDSAIYPYDYPTLFSVSAAFIVTVVVSLADRSNRATTDRSGYETQVVRSELGV